jgi:hypothetical protein
VEGEELFEYFLEVLESSARGLVGYVKPANSHHISETESFLWFTSCRTHESRIIIIHVQNIIVSEMR